MKVKNTELPNLYIIENNTFFDERGSFTKIFNKLDYHNANLNTKFEEYFYSKSHKNVLRGMHYQKESHSHDKLVHVIKGSILDVVVCIDKNSINFGKYFSTYLSSMTADNKSLYIGKEYAHGFRSLEDDTLVMYMTTTVHNSEADSGIRFDSFGFNWNIDEKDLIISKRDKNFIGLTEL